jgi:PAS domain S-box-containing protein
MSGMDTNGEFSTKLMEETFLQFVDDSTMGILILQRGFIKYFNKKFTQIFGYTEEDIKKWKKREFYKIVHPEDLPNLLKNLKIEDDKKTATIEFRGVRKDKKIIPIKNYNCYIYYNNKTSYLSSYILQKEPLNNNFIPKIIKTKEGRKIILDYSLNTVKTLEDNNLKFKTVSHTSYREEN